MSLDNFISIFGIFASIIISYSVASWTIKKEMNKSHNEGIIIIYELIKRYAISIINCVDPITRTVNNTTVSKNRHLRVIKRIEEDLLTLQTNIFYLSILKKYPRISVLQVQLSIEIAEHEDSENLYLNKGTITKFWELNEIIQPEIKKLLKENKEFEEINGMVLDILNKNKV